jgi:TRAP-type mannitol/chloroaromatic compound transport system permease large subunit
MLLVIFEAKVKVSATVQRLLLLKAKFFFYFQLLTGQVWLEIIFIRIQRGGKWNFTSEPSNQFVGS